MGGWEERSFGADQLFCVTPRRCGEERSSAWQPPVAGGNPGCLAQVLEQLPALELCKCKDGCPARPGFWEPAEDPCELLWKGAVRAWNGKAGCG